MAQRSRGDSRQMRTLIWSVDVRYIVNATARGLAIVWIGVLVLATLLQHRLMYFPSTEVMAPAAAGLPTVAATRMATPDGAEIVVWRAAAAAGKPTILYFHGNGGAIQGRTRYFNVFLDQGWGLAAMSYRGYSGSTGRASERANVTDALQLYDQLRAEGVPGETIIPFGESLGSGVAVQVAAARTVGTVILESPYASVVSVAQERMWYLPVSWLITDRYDSMAHVGGIKVPILILAGALDQVIPVEQSRRLAAAAPTGSRYVEYPQAGHIDTFFFGGIDETIAWVRARMGWGTGE